MADRFRLVAVGQISWTNVGGRRYLTLAGRAAERPVYFRTCRPETSGRHLGSGSSGRCGPATTFVGRDGSMPTQTRPSASREHVRGADTR